MPGNDVEDILAGSPYVKGGGVLDGISNEIRFVN